MIYHRRSKKEITEKQMIFMMLAIVLLVIVVTSGMVLLLMNYEKSVLNFIENNYVWMSGLLLALTLGLLIHTIYETKNGKNQLVNIKLLIETDNNQDVVKSVSEAINDLWDGTYKLRSIGDETNKFYLTTLFINNSENKLLFHKIKKAIEDTGLNVIFDHEDKPLNIDFNKSN